MHSFQHRFSLVVLLGFCLVGIVGVVATITLFQAGHLLITKTGQPSPLPSPMESRLTGQKILGDCGGAEALFVEPRSGDLTYFCSITNESKVISRAQSELVWYKQPRFVTKDTISYQECRRSGSSSNSDGPYTCYFMLLHSQDMQPKVLLAHSSVSNGSTHIGGDMNLVAWNHRRDAFAFVLPNYNRLTEPELDYMGTPGAVDLLVYTMGDSSTKLIAKLPTPDGRETGFDDEQKILFSPDDSLIYVQDTGIMAEKTTDELYAEPTIGHVFKTLGDPSNSLTWNNHLKQTTFGSFIDNNTLLYKEEPVFTKKNPGIYLSNIATGKKQFIRDATDWYGIRVWDSSHLLYSKYDVSSGKDSLYKYNFINKKVIRSWPNVMMIELLNQRTAVVGITAKCYVPLEGVYCGLSHEFEQLGLLDLENGKVTVMNIHSRISQWTGVDFRLITAE